MFIIAYIPVLHNGYIQFLNNYIGPNKENDLPAAHTLLLIDTEIFPENRALLKDLRAVDISIMRKQIANLYPHVQVEICDKKTLSHWQKALQSSEDLSDEEAQPIIMPKEQINEQLLERYFPKLWQDRELRVTFVDIFLRWDSKRSQSREDISPAQHITDSEFDMQIMNRVQQNGQRSLDWWRQVGAAVVVQKGENREIAILSRNTHLPYDQQPYIDGDPRADFSSGVCIEFASSIHAEALAVAMAANQGLSMQNAWVYVSTFPCPVCAKLLAKTGISKLFYADGYSLIHGQEILENAGIEIIQVKNKTT